MAEIKALVVFVAVAASSVATTGPTRPWLSPLTGLGPFALAPIIGAVSVAVLSFLGFDAIASFAEESAGSERDVGRAILVCLAAAGTVFILQTWLAALISPVNPGELASRPERQGTAFYDITRAALGPWLAIVLSITKGVGPAFAAMTAQAAAARLLFSMARDGRLPRALASVDAHLGVPRTALVTAAALTLLVSVWAARRSEASRCSCQSWTSGRWRHLRCSTPRCLDTSRGRSAIPSGPRITWCRYSAPSSPYG